MPNEFSVPAIEGRKSHYSVVIIGAGQAGLAMSYWLQKNNIDHLVLEKSNSIAHNWRDERWDNFCLVTPNWQCQLPGYPYRGSDPHGFMVKDQIIEYLLGYYHFLKPPVEFNCPVNKLAKMGNQFQIETPQKNYTANHVVLACGSYHRPYFLPGAKSIPEHIQQVHSRDYKNHQQLPEGDVLVVGTGQSGCQIAEDLHLEGRQVHLAVGNAPRVNRRYRGKDVVKWLDEMGYYKTTLENHPDGENAPHSTNHYVTGRDGGRDLNLRIFAEQGMKLYGHVDTINAQTISFKNDLYENLDYADSVAERIRESIETHIQKSKIDAPADENIHSSYYPPTEQKFEWNESGIKAVVWATGFKMDFSWVDLPAFDQRGRPAQKRGVSDVNGLYFLGLNWMHTWGSGRFFQVGQDAHYLTEAIKAKLQARLSA